MGQAHAAVAMRCRTPLPWGVQWAASGPLGFVRPACEGQGCALQKLLQDSTALREKALLESVHATEAFILGQSLLDMFAPLAGQGQGQAHALKYSEAGVGTVCSLQDLQSSTFYISIMAFERARLEAGVRGSTAHVGCASVAVVFLES